MSTGHFTQVVWKQTMSLCMGHAFSSDKQNIVIVARYSPRGNIASAFDTNVLPLLVVQWP